MKKQYIIALDQGTTSSRAIIFDKKGKICASAQKEFTQIFPKASWIEHDPNEIWKTQLTVLKSVIKKSKIPLAKIDSIGITNQRETTVVWDKTTGKPIYNAIVWQDRRTSNLCENYKKSGLEKSVRNKTGLALDAYFSATKIKWILDHVKGARKKANEGKLAFGTIDSWLLWKLTNGKRHQTDVSNASRTMLFNIKSLKWDATLCKHFDVPKVMLPEVKNTSDDFGVVDVSLLGKELPICSLVGDQQAALFGQQCTRKGMAKNTYGTGCFIVINTGNQIVKSSNRLISTIAWSINGKTTYALEGSVFMAGATIQWLRDGLKIIKNAKETEKIAQSVSDNGGVYFVPALTGLGTPHWDSFARGTILGITRGTKQAHIVRASLEGICLQVNDVIEAMKKDKIVLRQMRVDGGAVANEFLMQLQSNIAGVKILKPEILETTALGAAFFAGLQSGFWKSKKELENLWKLDRAFTPQISKKNRTHLLENWAKAIEKSKSWITD